MLLCASSVAFAGPVSIDVHKADGAALAGAVLMLDAVSAHLPRPAPQQVVLDQVSLAFSPDLVVIPVGSQVSFPNSDAVSHQVYSFSSAHRFQLPLYRGKPYPPVVFDMPGVVTLGCNIHDNMLAYVVVTDAPYFSRTDEHGAWRLPDVPDGTYRLKLWHPLINESTASLERELRVEGPSGATLSWKLAHPLRPAPLKGRPHSWDY